MYFEELYRCLIDEARLRVRTGTVTERGLARDCGMSQPHMHNVLKNIRALSAGSATRLMQALDLNMSQLLWRRPTADSATVLVPLLRSRIGPGTPASFTSFAGTVPFAQETVQGLVKPLAARLSGDHVMPRLVHQNDLVLLDQNPAARSAPGADSCWVVVENGGIRVRYVRMGGTRVYVVNESTLRQRTKWEAVSVQGSSILDIIKARIVWLGRDLSGSAEPLYIEPRQSS